MSKLKPGERESRFSLQYRCDRAEEQRGDLLKALRGMMQLVEHGVLVRDTSKDHETGWALHQLPLLNTLQKAQAAIAKAEGAETSVRHETDNIEVQS